MLVADDHTRSSNGRTTVFGAVNLGSSPSRVANTQKDPFEGPFVYLLPEESGAFGRARKAFEVGSTKGRICPKGILVM